MAQLQLLLLLLLLLLLPLQGRSAVLQELYQVRSLLLLLQAASLHTSACFCCSWLFEPVTPAGGSCACVLVHSRKHVQHVQPSCPASFTHIIYISISSSSSSSRLSLCLSTVLVVHAGRCFTTSLRNVTLRHSQGYTPRRVKTLSGCSKR
jgi:hypothetical protein